MDNIDKILMTIKYMVPLEYLKTHAIEIPEQTCNHIDKVLNDMMPVEDTCCKFMRHMEIDKFVDQIVSDLVDTKHELEDIRSANSDLRTLGKYWYDNYKDLYERVKEIEEGLKRHKNEHVSSS